MKRILLLMLLAISTMCFGCKSDKGKDPPPTDVADYFDIASMWLVYLKSQDEVRVFLKDVNMVERDSILRGTTHVIKVFTYVKDTPGGQCQIDYCFNYDTLISINALLPLYNSPQEAFPHYLSISNDIDELTNNNQVLFPFKDDFRGGASCGLPAYDDEDIYRQFQGNRNSRRDYLNYVTDKVNGYTQTSDDKFQFSFGETRTEVEYDPIIGRPADAPPENSILKRLSINLHMAAYGKIYVSFNVASQHTYYIEGLF